MTDLSPATASYFSQENTKKRMNGKANINKAGRENIILKTKGNNNNNKLFNRKNKHFFITHKSL